MTWAKLDDRFPWHPKVYRLSDKAFRLHVSALCYSAGNDTEGKLCATTLRFLSASEKHRQELLDAGVWERDESGEIRIHDFLKYHPTRAQAEARREANAERARNHRDRAQRNAVTNASQPEPRNTAPPEPAYASPGPARPDPLQNPPAVGSGADAPVAPPKVKRARRIRSSGPDTPWPEGSDWTPDLAEKLRRMGLNPATENEKMRDNALKKGLMYKDWEAARRTWVREAPRFLLNGKPPGAQTHEQNLLATRADPPREFERKPEPKLPSAQERLALAESALATVQGRP